MAEFRRLISYIYEYEGRAKGKNVGFVKLETRNGMCRLSVNVKNLYIGSSDMGVYLMSGRKEIFLGNMFLRNGCGEFRTVVQITDVQESGETMDECYGLTIHGKGENWRVYTTIWEDAIAQAAQLTLESVTSEAVLEHEVEKGKLSSVAPQAENDVKRDQAGEETAVMEKTVREERGRKPGRQGTAPPAVSGDEGSRGAGLQKMPEAAPKDASGKGQREKGGNAQEGEGGKERRETEGKQEEESREIPGIPPETPETKEAGNWPGAVRNSRKTWPTMNFRPAVNRITRPSPDMDSRPAADENVNPPAGEKAEFAINIPDFEMGRLEMETEHPDIPLGQMGKPEGAPPVPGGEKEEDRGRARPVSLTGTGQAAPVPVIRQHKEEPLLVGDPEALAKLDAEEALENQIPVWEFFSKTYPRIQAFDSEYGCQVLVIKPQDIGLLPREAWIYGNNSFLLHGYYNYRYLVLARLENPKGAPRYLLGIPGHYYSNEKYMASMFGFPHFVLSKKQPAQDGRFGYWYTDIRMDSGTVPGNMAAWRLKAGGE